MTDGDSLLRQIIDDPEDDTLRLAYADWLGENGRADQGEYIRLAIRLNGEAPKSPQCRAGYALMRGMLSERPLDPQWREVWPGAKMANGVFAYTWKGLFETVACPAIDWIMYGDGALKRWPIKRAILSTRPELLWGNGEEVILVDDPTPNWFWRGSVVGHAEEHSRDVVSSVCSLRWPKKGLRISVPPHQESVFVPFWETPQSDVPPIICRMRVDRAIQQIMNAHSSPAD